MRRKKRGREAPSKNKKREKKKKKNMKKDHRMTLSHSQTPTTTTKGFLSPFFFDRGECDGHPKNIKFKYLKSSIEVFRYG